MKEETLSRNHWNMEEYRERMTIKKWERILIDQGNAIMVDGKIRKLKVKKINLNIVEIYKESL